MRRQSANGDAHEDEHEGKANPNIFATLRAPPPPKTELAGSQSSNPFEEVPDAERSHSRRENLMAEPSREEIAAKLEAAEARTEARFAQLTGTLDVRFANLDTKIDRLVDSVGQLSAVVDEAKKEGRADNKTTRWTIIVVVVASVLAGLAALWTTQANLLAAFQAGLAVKTLQSGPPKP